MEERYNELQGEALAYALYSDAQQQLTLLTELDQIDVTDLEVIIDRMAEELGVEVY